jgi:hypothetical protein
MKKKITSCIHPGWAAFKPAFGPNQNDDQHDNHQDADHAAHHLLVEINGNLCPDDAADHCRYGQDQAAPHIEDLLLAETADGNHILKQNCHPVGTIGDIGGKAKKDQERQGDQRTAPGQGIYITACETGSDYSRIKVPFHAAHCRRGKENVNVKIEPGWHRSRNINLVLNESAAQEFNT